MRCVVLIDGRNIIVGKIRTYRNLSCLLVERKFLTVMKMTTAVIIIMKGNPNGAEIYSKRSLALASIQTWRLDRLEEVPSVLGGIQSASAPSRTYPIG